jgi:Zn finger protein HypA/HybF involved in hydrogenase expression
VRVAFYLSLLAASLAAIGAAGAFSRSAPPLVLRGTDGQNARPFTLTRDANLVWSCPGCRNSNFAVTTNQDIPVNALGPTHGVSFLQKGRYTGVSVTATGPWVIRLSAAAARPVARSYTLTGVDGENVRPFTLTHGSDVIWSCPRCTSSNFAVTTDQDIPVNALGHTHGTSYLEKGRYTGVSVTASGPWKIVLR